MSPKSLHWVGSAKRDLLKFPEAGVDDIGYGLGLVQQGGFPPSSKPWKGEGPGVFELVEDFRGDPHCADRRAIDWRAPAGRAGGLRGAPWAENMKRSKSERAMCS